MRSSIVLLSCFASALFACASNEVISDHVTDAGKDAKIIDAASEVLAETSASSDAGVFGPIESGSFDLGTPDNSLMLYNGGPVLSNPINVYLIWYGDWNNRQSTRSVLEYMVQNIAATSLFKINNKYWENVASATSLPQTVDGGDAGFYSDASFDAASYPDAGTAFVSGTVNLVTSLYSYTANYNKLMKDNDVQTLIQTSITNGSLPLDPNGVYFVLTSPDIVEIYDNLEACDDYCGYHSAWTFQNTNIKYSWIGDTARCPDDCSVQGEYAGLDIMNSPNNDWSADGMSTIILHELSEAVTDPDPFTHIAWIAQDGSEIGDSCAWTFGQPYWTDAGSVANIQVGDKQFMLQQLWDLDDAGGHCSLTP